VLIGDHSETPRIITRPIFFLGVLSHYNSLHSHARPGSKNSASPTHYLDVYEYPDGRIEIRANGGALPCSRYDRLSEIDQGAVIENKRLGHALRVAQQVQAERDNRRAAGSPSRTNRGDEVRPRVRPTGSRKQRELTTGDLNAIVLRTAGQQAGSVPETPAK
jgi:hypothetical protein